MIASLNWVDFLLLGVVIVSVALSAWKGFVREIIMLGAVLVGVTLAATSYARAGKFFEDLVKSHEIALGLGFLTLFLGVVVVGSLVSAAVRKLVKSVGLNWFDRFLGGVFGLARGVLIASIMLMAMTAFALKSKAVSESRLVPYMMVGARAVAAVMPWDVKSKFREGYQKFRQIWMEAEKKGQTS